LGKYVSDVKKSGMREFKTPKNMLPTHKILHFCEQWQSLNTRRVYIIAFTKMTLGDHSTTSKNVIEFQKNIIYCGY
jgi:hypothetical protein